MINFLESKLTIALEQRLQIWADWFSHGNRLALGYPPVSITYWACYQMPKQKVGKQISALPAHAEAEGIEQQVYELALSSPLLAKALRCQYFTLGTLRYKAEQLHLTTSQFKLYVDMAKVWLAARLASSK